MIEVKELSPDLKIKWMEALRSGEYEQASGYLYLDGAYCCLGVLAIISGVKISDIDGVSELERVALKLAQSFDNEDRDVKCKLENMNDGVNEERKHSFPEIADWVEVNL